ncbi:TPA: type 1 fimbrial protein [Salmonella enterica subsp. enterica serovar Muenchen]|nr:type 1 fimbrial protein [Salmonella enterica subsp. enterica serovar Muenchen]HEC8861206.1 type 1 fimbrial protein [Salmonella enterica subsp. enterica serovar Muenchen]
MESDKKWRHALSLLFIAAGIIIWMAMLVVLGLLLATESHAANSDGSIDVQFRGRLSAGACVLDPVSENIDIPFPEVTGKFFHLYDKGPERRFQLRLKECDTGRTVKVQFRGTRATAPGLEGTLKLTSPLAGMENELGIQLIEYVDGQPKDLVLSSGSVSGTTKTLAQTTEVLTFGAWLKPSTMVRNGGSVTPGEYRAVATFDLIYD